MGSAFRDIVFTSVIVDILAPAIAPNAMLAILFATVSLTVLNIAYNLFFLYQGTGADGKREEWNLKNIKKTVITSLTKGAEKGVPIFLSQIFGIEKLAAIIFADAIFTKHKSPLDCTVKDQKKNLLALIFSKALPTSYFTKVLETKDCFDGVINMLKMSENRILRSIGTKLVSINDQTNKKIKYLDAKTILSYPIFISAFSLAKLTSSPKSSGQIVFEVATAAMVYQVGQHLYDSAFYAVAGIKLAVNKAIESIGDVYAKLVSIKRSFTLKHPSRADRKHAKLSKDRHRHSGR